MSNLKFIVSAEDLAKIFGEAKAEVEQAITSGVGKLASMTHAKVIELANEGLNTTRKLYTDNLDFKEITPGVWVVSLDEKALWIEEGRKSGSMVDDLLRNGSKVSKDGNRYKAIPFDHGKPSGQQGPKAKEYTQLLKQELKTRNIPFKKLELNADGSPRVGKLHSFDVDSPRPSDKASHPALAGVTIYQTKSASGNVRRDIMTFRIVSDKSKKEGKFIHPGLEAKKYFEKAFDWAEKEWTENILPEILKQYDKK